MEFDDFIKTGKVVSGEKDSQKANYYGEHVSTEIAVDAKNQIKELCKTLKEKYI